MSNKKITIFIHIYYENTILTVFRQLKHLIIRSGTSVFVNINFDNPNFLRIKKIIENRYPNIYLIKTSNKGKDIGGKLALLKLYLQLNLESDYLLFLHDKKSPQLVHGDSWKQRLFKIADEESLKKVFKLFDSPNVGMIGQKEHIMNKKNEPESKIFVKNKDLIMSEAAKYNLSSKDYAFVGGTMFWVRENIFRLFFIKSSPLKIRSNMELGNVMDDFGPTVTHSWERLLGWVVSTKGYKIKGI